jgi:hypothetical protein
MLKKVMTGPVDRRTLAAYLKETKLVEHTECGYNYEPYPVRLVDETDRENFTLLVFVIGVSDTRQSTNLTYLLEDCGEDVSVTVLLTTVYDTISSAPGPFETDVLVLVERVLFDYGFPVEDPERFAPLPTDPVKKFERTFRDYTAKQLQKVIDGKQYVPDAKRAAKNVLYRMKYGE